MKRKELNMLEGPLLPSVLSYTIPIILTSVLQLLFNAADLVVVGRFRGSLCVGAVGTTGALTNLIVNLFLGLATGTGVTVAHAIGARQHKTLHRLIHTSMFVSLFGGAVLTIVGVSLSGTFLRLMDTPAEILPLATTYMRIYFCGMTFSMIYNFCAAILRAAGDTKGPLLYLTSAGVLNVILNIIFVLGFGMDVDGVALATILSQGLSAFLVVRALVRRTDECHLDMGQVVPHWGELKRITRIGLPAGIQGSLFAISNVTIQSAVNSFGDAVVSGSAAAANIEGFVYVAMNAFYQTTVNFTGQNAGAGQLKRVKKIIATCMLCCTVTGLVLGIGAYLAAPVLLRIYITDSAEAIGYGIIRLAYVSVPYALCGLMEITTGGLRGLNSSLTPMIISIIGTCGIRIGWILTFFQQPEFHTLGSLFATIPVSWIITVLAQLLALVVVYRRQLRRAPKLSA